MTNGNGNGSGDKAPKFSLRQIYIKDLSFESPNSPGVFAEAFNPNVALNLQNQNHKIGDETWEVVLKLNVHATVGERSIFMVELDQAGLFEISGYKPEEVSFLLGSHCPATLYPYAREAISSVVVKGGFPPLLLQPLNFDELFAQSQRKTEQA